MALCLQSQVAVHLKTEHVNSESKHLYTTSNSHFADNYSLHPEISFETTAMPGCQWSFIQRGYLRKQQSSNSGNSGCQLSYIPHPLFSILMLPFSSQFFSCFSPREVQIFCQCNIRWMHQYSCQTEDCPQKSGMGCAERMRKPIIPHHQKCTMLVCTKSCYFFLLPGYYALVKTGLRPLLCSLALSLWWIWMTYNGIWNKGLAISCSSNSLILIVILCSMLYA